MGMFDEYGKNKIQSKLGPCALHQYEIGDKVHVPDGLHMHNEGWFLVKEGVLIAEGIDGYFNDTYITYEGLDIKFKGSK